MSNFARRTFVSIALAILLPGALVHAADLDNGRRVFASNCVVCHGPVGKADESSPVVQGLGVVPADFSDALFNSREPAGDWEMVIKYGGASLGLAEQMPAHEQVLSDDDIADVTAYAKTLADTRAYPPGEMNLMLPVRTKKAFPEDEVVYKGRFTPQDGDDAIKSVIEFEKRLGKRGQFILELVHEAEGSIRELAEAEVGYKQAISFSQSHVLSAAAVVAIPVEADGDGEFQAYLAYGRELSPMWTLQSSLRLKFPFDSGSSGSMELAGIVHYTHSPWPRRVFPALELIAEAPFDSGDGDLELSALPQVRIGLTRGGHVALNLGVELPLTGQDWNERYHVTLLWDFADGSFFKGW